MILAYRINLPLVFGAEVLLCREEKICTTVYLLYSFISFSEVEHCRLRRGNQDRKIGHFSTVARATLSQVRNQLLQNNSDIANVQFNKCNKLQMTTEEIMVCSSLLLERQILNIFFDKLSDQTQNGIKFPDEAWKVKSLLENYLEERLFSSKSSCRRALFWMEQLFKPFFMISTRESVKITLEFNNSMSTCEWS